MIVLPMRSQDSSPNRQDQDLYTTSIPALHRAPSPHISEFRKQVAGAMLSVIPSTRPPPPKRPKLSLQTAIPLSPPTKRLGSSLDISTDSPTAWNTHVNTFEAPPPVTFSAEQAPLISPSSSINSLSTSLSSTASGNSPFSRTAPYVLPIGAQSILRNSLLPRRHLSATSARAPRRMFPPVKRVTFQEKLVEVVPTPSIEDSSDLEPDIEPTEDEHQRRMEEIQAEDGHAIPIHGRRKRRREWVWRPLSDDILIQNHAYGTRGEMEIPTRIPLPDSAIEDADDTSMRTHSLQEDARNRVFRIPDT